MNPSNFFPRFSHSSLKIAQAHVKSMQADLGGTQILPPLMGIFQTNSMPGIPRQLFVFSKF
jgi:hypothetical protein